MPVGDGPADLFLPLTLLVRLVVSDVVDLLAGADQDMDRRPGDERRVPGSAIPLFAADPGNLLPCCLFGRDDVHDALAEPGAGRMLPGLDDALDDLVGYRFLRKVPDHPAFSKHILELHGIKPPLARSVAAAKTLHSGEETDQVAVRILDDRVALAPERVPRRFVAAIPGVGQ